MKLLNTCALIKPKVTVTNCLIMELILTEGLQNRMLRTLEIIRIKMCDMASIIEPGTLWISEC